MKYLGRMKLHALFLNTKAEKEVGTLIDKNFHWNKNREVEANVGVLGRNSKKTIACISWTSK